MELKKRLTDAAITGLSIPGQDTSTKLLQTYQVTFRLRLGSGRPSRICPMRIKIDAHRHPVRVRVRHFRSAQRVFLHQCINRQVDIGFLIPNPQAAWQVVPRLDPKDSPIIPVRITNNRRLVNAATKAETWPMPSLEAELADFSGS